jgi:pilus assembly protein CpaB
MKRKRLLIMVGLALLSGLAAAYIAIDYLATQRPTIITPQRTAVKAAVAARDLALGAVVTAEDVRLLDWPGEMLPAGYVATAEAVVGRALIRPVSANEPFLEMKLAGGSGRGLPVLIPEGMRAVSVRVDEVIGVAGFVLAETRVDVLVTIAPPADNRERITRVVLQNILVLAAGQAIEQTADGKPMTVTVITLLVTPEQAETLTRAANEGRIQLALRGVLDLEEVTTTGVRVASLVAGAQTGPPRRVDSARPSQRVTRAGDRGAVVELFKGGGRTLTVFND